MGANNHKVSMFCDSLFYSEFNEKFKFLWSAITFNLFLLRKNLWL